jgi:hypothetical protein
MDFPLNASRSLVRLHQFHRNLCLSTWLTQAFQQFLMDYREIWNQTSSNIQRRMWINAQ